jgi:hypothetical protein
MGTAGAVHDLIVTAAFATPRTASATVSALRSVHNGLHVGGDVCL